MGYRYPGPPIEIIRLIFEERRRGEVHPTLRPDLGLIDGQPMHLARTEWFAVHTPGHTHDHLCLYDPTEGVMLSGDHVLPTITAESETFAHLVHLEALGEIERVDRPGPATFAPTAR